MGSVEHIACIKWVRVRIGLMQIKKWTVEKIPYLLIFTISLHTLSWFQEDLLVAVGDLIPSVNPMYPYQHLWTWDEINCGVPNIILPRLFFPIYTIPMVFTVMGFKIFEAQRLYVIIMYFLSGASMYFLASQMGINTYRKQVLGFFSAIFYMFNPYLLSSGPHSAILLLPGYVLKPLTLALCVRGLREEKLRYAIFIALLSPVLISTSPSYVDLFLTVFLLASYVIFYLIMRRDMNTVKKAVKFLCVLLCLSILVNIWSLMPYLQNLHIYALTLENLRVSSSVAKWATLTEVLRLLGYWGFYSSYRGMAYYPYASMYVSNPLMVTLTFTYPLMAFSAFIIDRKNESVRFFLVLACISLFLAKGPNLPAGDVFTWLINNIPFLKVLRDPYRFVRITVIAYSFLIGFTCASIFYLSQGAARGSTPQSRGKRRRSALTVSFGFKCRKIAIPVKALRYGISVALIFWILVGSWPLLTGDIIANWYYDKSQRGVKIPQEYYEAEQWFKDREDYFRIFVLPQRGTYIAYTWGYTGADILCHLFSKPIVSGVGGQYVQPYASDSIERVYNSFYENQTSYIGKVLGIMGVKYILVETSVDTEFYECPSVSRDINLLESQVGIKKVQTFGSLLIYENEFFRPLVRVPVSVRLLNASIDCPLGVGWKDDDFRAGWEFASGNLSTDGEVAYRTLASEGSYISSIMSRSISINTKEYLYLLIRFKSNQYSSLIVFVGSPQGNIYLYANNPTKDSYRNAYKSTSWYTLAYRVEEENITSINLVITNVENREYRGKLELWFDYVLCAKFIGDVDDLIRSMQEGDVIFLNQEGQSNLALTFLNQYNLSDCPPKFLFERINPTEYIVHIGEATSPFLLVFGSSYDTKWKAYIEGSVVREHLIINGYANGWIISKSGNYDVVLKYEPQRWFYYGSIISITTILTCLTYLTYNWTKNKAIWKRTKRLIRRVHTRT